MASRRAIAAADLEPTPVPGRELLISTPMRTSTRALRVGEKVLLGTAADVSVQLEDGPLHAVSLELRADGGVEVGVLPGAAVRLNDVQVQTSAQARVGDLLVVGEAWVVVQAVSARPAPRGALMSLEAFGLQLEAEVSRSEVHGRPLSLWAVRSRTLGPVGQRKLLEQPELATEPGVAPFTLTEFAPQVWLMLLPDASLAQSETSRARLAQALSRFEDPVQWGGASLPKDGVDAHALLGRALERLLADDLRSGGVSAASEPLREDPVMARLFELIQRVARSAGPFVLRGEPSVGKEVFARALHAEAATEGAPFVPFACADYTEARWEAALERARGGTLYLQHLPALPAAVRASLLGRIESTRLIVSAPRDLPFEAPVALQVPALRDRPQDILPLAEGFLQRAAERLGRRGLTLSPAAQTVLREDLWPGNLRELKNAMVRAALAAETAEVRPEHLTPRLLRDRARRGPGTGLRATMKAQEREVLLDALGRTAWNVTAAATALGLPRRTVVYRMSRLNLRRPR